MGVVRRGVVGGGVVGGAVVGGAVVGGGVGVVVTLPVQVTPLTVKAVGTLLVVVQLPLKPMPVSVAPVAMLPLYDMLVTRTAEPDWLTVPFHSWVTIWPLANVQPSVQLDIGSPRLVMFTFAPKPPGHWLVMV